MNKVIAINGPSCSGKTTLAKNILKYSNSILIHQDDYYMGINTKTGDELPQIGNWKNMETPVGYDYSKLHEVLVNLKNNKPAIGLTYSKELNELKDSNKRSTKKLHPKKIIIVEGLHPVYNENIRKITDLSLYLDVPEELILKRRIERDGNIWEEYCKEVVIPEYRKISNQLKRFIDYRLDGNNDLDTMTYMTLDLIETLY